MPAYCYSIGSPAYRLEDFLWDSLYDLLNGHDQCLSFIFVFDITHEFENGELSE